MEGDFLFRQGGGFQQAPARANDRDADRVFEGPGIIVPPFFDTHLHGGWGREFLTADDFAFLEKKLKSHGIGRAIPTYLNVHWENLAGIASQFRRYRRESGSGFFPFLRCESPFINPEMRGYQSADAVYPATRREIAKLPSLSRELKMITIAPEMPGSQRLIRAALASGIMVSLGHSRARFAEFVRFRDLGIRHFTHFAIRLSPLHHRELGMVGAGLFFKDTFLEIIGDGGHTADEFVELVFRWRHGRDLALVSDTHPMAGLGGEALSRHGLIREGKVLKTGSGLIAGGETLLPEQIRRLSRNTAIPLAQLLAAASVNPYRFFGIRPGRGSFLALDANLRPLLAHP